VTTVIFKLLMYYQMVVRRYDEVKTVYIAPLTRTPVSSHSSICASCHSASEVKLWSNKILQILGEGCQLTRVKGYETIVCCVPVCVLVYHHATRIVWTAILLYCHMKMPFNVDHSLEMPLIRYKHYDYRNQT